MHLGRSKPAQNAYGRAADRSGWPGWRTGTTLVMLNSSRVATNLECFAVTLRIESSCACPWPDRRGCGTLQKSPLLPYRSVHACDFGELAFSQSSARRLSRNKRPSRRLDFSSTKLCQSLALADSNNFNCPSGPRGRFESEENTQEMAARGSPDTRRARLPPLADGRTTLLKTDASAIDGFR
jgi:hypothetical protein